MRIAQLTALALVLCMPTPSAQAPAPATAVDPRLTEAIGWYTGTAGRMDDARAHARLLEAAADEDPISQMWLARCYSRGRMQFERDEAKARAISGEVRREVARLAAANVAEAAFLMGTVYDEGLSVDADPPLAAAWFHRAADMGHLLAEHNLGNAYAAGRGVPQSAAMAVYWWRRPAAAGDVVPQFRLAQMYEGGRGVERDPRQAVEWYRRAAERGYAAAREALKRLEPKR